MTTTRLGSAWRTRLTHIFAVTLLGIGLVGCTPEVEPTPSSTPSETPTPTPTWKPKEQAAIDAVERYITTYVDLSHKLPVLTEEDWDQIYATTVDPRRTEMLDFFAVYVREGRTATGTPSFTVDRAESAGSRDDGEFFTVSGCYLQEDFQHLDSSGSKLDLAWLRSYQTYIVFATHEDRYYVSDIQNQEEAC